MQTSDIVDRPLEDRRAIARRVLDFIFGYDFFISYAWTDGATYAEQLARRLEQSGFDVFLDRDDYEAGADWRRVGRWTLHRTGQLILVGSPLALESEPVAHEVRIFAETGRRILPIEFGGSLERLPPSNPLAAHLRADHLKIREVAGALTDGPTDETLKTLRNTFHLVRQDKKRLRALGVVVFALALLAVAAALFGVRASISQGLAEAATGRAEASLVAEQRERRRAVANERAARESARKESEARDREASQRRVAEERQRFAEEQRGIAEAQRRIAEQQRRTAEMRQREAMAGQRFTEAATHFARAETAESAWDVETFRRRDLLTEIAGETAGTPGREARRRNLEAEVVEANRELQRLADAASRARADGRSRLAEGQTLWAGVRAMGGANGPPHFGPTQPGLFSVEVLSVGFGQSLFIHYGSPDAPRFAVVDGGRRQAFAGALGPRLESLRRRWSPDAPLPLELVAVSNQDEDRLGGLMALFDRMLERRRDGVSPEFAINHIWYNSFGPVDPAARWPKMRARGQVEQLGLPLNAPFDHLVMRPEAGRVSIDFPDGLRATILHPDRPSLERLLRMWHRELARPRRTLDPENGTAVSTGVPLIFPEERFSAVPIVGRGRPAPPLSPGSTSSIGNSDGSDSNLASLVILFEYGGMRFLHPGDARGDQILAGLAAAGLLDADGGIDIDLLLLPHLGSHRNVTADFLSRVRADRYLLTSNGTFNDPAQRVLSMLLEARRGACIQLYFLNRDGSRNLGPTIDAFFANLPEGNCFRRVFRSGTREALVIDLMGRVRY